MDYSKYLQLTRLLKNTLKMLKVDSMQNGKVYTHEQKIALINQNLLRFEELSEGTDFEICTFDELSDKAKLKAVEGHDGLIIDKYALSWPALVEHLEKSLYLFNRHGDRLDGPEIRTHPNH